MKIAAEEYKTMKEILTNRFGFYGQYDVLLRWDYYNINRLNARNSPIGKPAVIEKLPIRMKVASRVRNGN